MKDLNIKLDLEKLIILSDSSNWAQIGLNQWQIEKLELIIPTRGDKKPWEKYQDQLSLEHPNISNTLTASWEKVSCPRCGSNDVVKAGLPKNKQRYLCRDCQKNNLTKYFTS